MKTKAILSTVLLFAVILVSPSTAYAKKSHDNRGNNDQHEQSNDRHDDNDLEDNNDNEDGEPFFNPDFAIAKSAHVFTCWVA
jgi:hypothetical protein